MSDSQQNEPSEDDLVAFAAELLGRAGQNLADEELLRETVREARSLWTELYRVTKGA